MEFLGIINYTKFGVNKDNVMDSVITYTLDNNVKTTMKRQKCNDNNAVYRKFSERSIKFFPSVRPTSSVRA